MTISYVEKGDGLHPAIRAAGHWLREENGVWVSSDDAAVQVIIDNYVAPDPLDAAKMAKSTEVSAHAKRLRDRVVAAISAGEMASWAVKLAEARDFAANADPARCPMLSAEASARGVTLADMVTKVAGNAKSFSAIEATIGGTDGRHRDAIKALGTLEAVHGYDYSAGWPAV